VKLQCFKLPNSDPICFIGLSGLEDSGKQAFLISFPALAFEIFYSSKVIEIRCNNAAFMRYGNSSNSNIKIVY
jgi:hypothetical protein